MRNTLIYQFILNEGAMRYAHALLLTQGERIIGKPTEKQRNRLNAIEDLERLTRMVLKMHSAKNWERLLRVK